MNQLRANVNCTNRVSTTAVTQIKRAKQHGTVHILLKNYIMEGIIMNDSSNECMPRYAFPPYVPVLVIYIYMFCCLLVGADNVKIEFDASMVVKIAIFCAHLIRFDIFYTAVNIKKKISQQQQQQQKCTAYYLYNRTTIIASMILALMYRSSIFIINVESHFSGDGRLLLSRQRLAAFPMIVNCVQCYRLLCLEQDVSILAYWCIYTAFKCVL